MHLSRETLHEASYPGHGAPHQERIVVQQGRCVQQAGGRSIVHDAQQQARQQRCAPQRQLRHFL